MFTARTDIILKATISVSNTTYISTAAKCFPLECPLSLKQSHVSTAVRTVFLLVEFYYSTERNQWNITEFKISLFIFSVPSYYHNDTVGNVSLDLCVELQHVKSFTVTLCYKPVYWLVCSMSVWHRSFS